MTLPRELNEDEIKWTCEGLRLIIRDIEEVLRRKYSKAIEERVTASYYEITELTDRIKTIENLYKTIGSCVVELKIPPGELVKQKDGSFRRQE